MSTPSLNSAEQTMLTLINNYRQQNNVAPLSVSPTLTASANWLSCNMSCNNYISHTDSLNRDPYTRMSAFGFSGGTKGENVAAGYSDPNTTFNQWINSCDPDSSGACTYAHKANILNSQYTVIGIGLGSNPSSTYNYYWTVDFGSPADAGSVPANQVTTNSLNGTCNCSSPGPSSGSSQPVPVPAPAQPIFPIAPPVPTVPQFGSSVPNGTFVIGGQPSVPTTGPTMVGQFSPQAPTGFGPTGCQCPNTPGATQYNGQPGLFNLQSAASSGWIWFWIIIIILIIIAIFYITKKKK